MADVPTQKKSGLFEELVFLLAGLLLLAVIFARLTEYLNFWGFASLAAWWQSVVDWFLSTVWPVWKVVATILSVLAVVWLIYSQWKLGAINAEDRAYYNPTEKELAATEEEEGKHNKRWKQIIDDIHSESPADWRLAIVEADTMLDESLRNAGFSGESLGEILQSLDANELVSIDEAWEAHKTRNRIAHDGSGFELTQREAKRIIGLYERVFLELGVI